MFALFLVILPVTVKAQGEAMISGKILSTEKEIVDFATVYLKGTNYGERRMRKVSTISKLPQEIIHWLYPPSAIKQ